MGYITSENQPTLKTITNITTNIIEPNPYYFSWFQKDQLLMSWPLSSLFEEIFPYIVGLTKSYDVSQALIHAFGNESHMQQLHLRIQFQELSKEDKSIFKLL